MTLEADVVTANTAYDVGRAAPVTQTPDGRLRVEAAGGAAAGAPAGSESPFKMGLVHKATPPLLTDGWVTEALADSRGNLRVAPYSGNTPATIGSGGATQVAGANGFITPVLQYAWNGTLWDRINKPNLNKQLLTSLATTNADFAKAAAGELHRIFCYVARATGCWLKLYNKASPPTVGTDVPTHVIYLAPTAKYDQEFDAYVFPAGIAYAFTTGPLLADVTGIAAGDVLGFNLLHA